MDRPAVILSGLEPGYVLAFAELCEQLGASILQTTEVPSLPGVDIGLCVVFVSGSAGDTAERARRIRKLLPETPLVVLAEGLGPDEVMRLVRLGVAEVIGLPAPPNQVAARAVEFSWIDQGESGASRIVGQSRVATRLRHEVRTAARAHAVALITGETGTGKGLVAEAIHQLSPRSEHRFVHVDCGALSPSLIESELFGHERGAFTGASSRRLGRFELAAGGTIFLDEIGDLDLSLQKKLLRVLQDGRFERLGGSDTLPMKARVIAATHRDLPRAIEDGRFRADLYFRLKVFEINVPPLRDRAEDIPLLVQRATSQLASRYGVVTPRVSIEFVRLLSSHGWPGNVRELINVLERLLVVKAGATLEAEDLEGVISVPSITVPRSLPSGRDLRVDEWTERERIVETLRYTGGNVLRASRLLKISREKLRYRIKKYEIDSLLRDD